MSTGDIIVGGILVIIFAAIIASLVRKKQAGKRILCDGCESSDCCDGTCGLSEQAIADMRRALDDRDAQKNAGFRA